MRTLLHLAALAAAGALLTGCGPPGARDLRHGEELIQAGRCDEAIAPLKDATQILATAPRVSQAKAWNLLGLAYHGAGKWDEASKAYIQARNLDRNNAAVDYNLGCLRLERSDYFGAADYLNSYVILRPKDANGYLKLGAADFHKAQAANAADRSRLMDSARTNFDAAEKIRPTAQAANALGLIDLLRRTPGADAIKAAQAHFELALRRDPQYSPALLNLAILTHHYLNQRREALARYKAYLALQPPPPYTNQVAALASQLDLFLRITITPSPAERPLPPPPARGSPAPTNAGPVKPTVTPAETPVTHAFAPAPRPAPALEKPPLAPPLAANPPPSLAASPPPPTPPPEKVELPPSPAPPVAPAVLPVQTPASVNTSNLANPLATEDAVPPPGTAPRESIAQKLNPLRWFSGKPSTPADASDAGTAIVPKGTRYKYPAAVTPIPGNRAQAERLAAQAALDRKQGRMAEAVRGYQDAVRADPTCFEAGLALGLASIDSRDYPTALAALSRALELREASADARYAFAWTLQKSGYYEDAATELEKLLAAHPREVRACLLLGNLYAEKLGRPKSARDQYARVLELDPENPQAGAIRAWIGKKP